MGRNKSRGGGSSRPNTGSGAVSRDLKSLDYYLEQKHLQRKATAKDGSCLFRAISEQVGAIHTSLTPHLLLPFLLSNNC